MSELKMTICTRPEECCKELSRVWRALGNPNYNGLSASENVAKLVQRVEQTRRDAAVAATYGLTPETYAPESRT